MSPDGTINKYQYYLKAYNKMIDDIDYGYNQNKPQ
jgi:hypothetical protein